MNCCSLSPYSDDTPVAKTSTDGAGAEVDDEDGTGGNGRLWRTVIIGEQEHRIDMQVIRPYLRVISHGGRLSQTTYNSFVYLIFKGQ